MKLNIETTMNEHMNELFDTTLYFTKVLEECIQYCVDTHSMNVVELTKNSIWFKTKNNLDLILYLDIQDYCIFKICFTLKQQEINIDAMNYSKSFNLKNVLQSDENVNKVFEYIYDKIRYVSDD